MEQQREAQVASTSVSDRSRWIISALEIVLRSVIQVTFIGSIVVLFLSHKEKPHQVPLRAYIAGYSSGCFAHFSLSLFRMHFAGGYPLTGRIGTAVRCLGILLACFFVSWVIVGCYWATAARITRSDAPSLFVWSVVLVISSASIGGLLLTISCIATR